MVIEPQLENQNFTIFKAFHDILLKNLYYLLEWLFIIYLTLFNINCLANIVLTLPKMTGNGIQLNLGK